MATAQLSDIYRFQAVTATLGTAGQPTAEQFDAVKDAGYEVVINLALGTTPRDLPNEPGIVARGRQVVVSADGPRWRRRR